MKRTLLALESSVMFSDGEVFSPLGEDADEYAPNLTGLRGKPAVEKQKPKTETQGDFVIEIPKNSDIESLILEDVYIGSGAGAIEDRLPEAPRGCAVVLGFVHEFYCAPQPVSTT